MNAAAMAKCNEMRFDIRRICLHGLSSMASHAGRSPRSTRSTCSVLVVQFVSLISLLTNVSATTRYDIFDLLYKFLFTENTVALKNTAAQA